MHCLLQGGSMSAKTPMVEMEQMGGVLRYISFLELRNNPPCCWVKDMSIILVSSPLTF